MSALKVNTIQNFNGVEQYLCKAWVNFNGTGTVAIRAAGNVSSITDNGTGDYTVNFTNAFFDTNYAIHGFTRRLNSGAATDANINITVMGGQIGTWPLANVMTTSACRILTAVAGSGTSDPDIVCVAVFR